MSEKTQVILSNPCHEQWGDMQPNANGRFCGSCQKTVVDFTMMSDQEVLAWFSSTQENVCGRFIEDQLNRDLVPARLPKKNRWAVWHFLLAGLLMGSRAEAQDKAPAPPAIKFNNVPDTGRPVRIMVGGIPSNSPDHPDVVLLLIMDSASEQPVAGATVHINNMYFSADATGAVKIGRERFHGAKTLEITSVGYAKMSVAIEKKWLQEGVKLIGLSISAQVLGETVVAVSTGRIRIGGAMARICIRNSIISDTMALFTKKPFTVYPNPVARGGAVTLSLRMDKPGNYMIQLFNVAGVMVESIRIEGVDGPRTELLNIPSTVAAGSYIIRLAHEQTGKVYTQKVQIL